MRLLIEVDDEEVQKQINSLVSEDKIEIIQSYDKFEKLTKDLQKVQSAIDLLKSQGYSMKILGIKLYLPLCNVRS
jgi:hypothetical protein